MISFEGKFGRAVLLWFVSACLLRAAYECRRLDPAFIVIPGAVALAALGCVAAWRGWRLMDDWRKSQQ
jgi:hypothetical protein